MQTLTFRGLTIAYDDRVLRPRPWTAAQAGWAAELLDAAPAGAVLELCAGAGHIGLGAIRDHDRQLVMVDVSEVAEEFALRNAAANGLADRVAFRRAELTAALEDERFAVIIADPPWVPSGSTTRFPQDPLLAIDGGDDGLDLARTCVRLIDEHLVCGGAAILQLGTLQQMQHIAGFVQATTDLRVSQHREFDDGVLVELRY